MQPQPCPGKDAEEDENEHASAAEPLEDDSLRKVQVPLSMSGLDLKTFSVLDNFLGNYMRADYPSHGSMFGGMVNSLPCDPSQPTTCGYVVDSMPVPFLGNLPRESIFEELVNDKTKEVKQRRDLGFPDGPLETQQGQQVVKCSFQFQCSSC